MASYLESGNTVHVRSANAVAVHKSLPAGTYMIKSSTFDGMFLEQAEALQVPEKIYGEDIDQRVSRVITTFKDRSKSTGVLLTGLKGSGKTLLAKCLSRQLLKEGVPTILVNDPHEEHDLAGFISSVDTPSLFLFDEFEKIFDKNADQNRLLTLLDGTGATKHLYVLTTNTLDINERFLNRPGRIFYAFVYGSMPISLATRYIDDTLRYPQHRDDMLVNISLFSMLNFDLLQAMVEEVNRFNQPLSKLIRNLNASPFRDERVYTVDVQLNGRSIPPENFSPAVAYHNPLASSKRSYGPEVAITLGDASRHEQRLTRLDCIKIIPGGGFVFSLDKVLASIKARLATNVGLTPDPNEEDGEPNPPSVAAKRRKARHMQSFERALLEDLDKPAKLEVVYTPCDFSAIAGFSGESDDVSDVDG